MPDVPAEAAKRFKQSLELVEKIQSVVRCEGRRKAGSAFQRRRVALAKGDLATAKQESAAYASGAEERHNSFRIRGAHELAGAIALKEKSYDTAIAELGQGNQQDPQVLYTLRWHIRQG